MDMLKAIFKWKMGHIKIIILRNNLKWKKSVRIGKMKAIIDRHRGKYDKPLSRLVLDEVEKPGYRVQ